MKLYEINQQIEQLIDNIDPETGEALFDEDALNELMLARDEKIEQVALAVKNITAEADAIATEIKKLTERKRVLENKAESIRDYLQRQLDGAKFQTAKVAISYRNTKSVEIDEAKFWEHPASLFVRTKKEADKTAIRKAIENGQKVPGAEIVVKSSMQVR